MKVSDLRHRLSIEELTRTSDGSGGNTEVWSEFAEVWAQVKPSSGVEFASGQQLKNVVTHNITIRYKAGVKPGMRIIFKSREFDIHSVVDVDERNIWLKMRCEEVIR